MTDIIGTMSVIATIPTTRNRRHHLATSSNQCMRDGLSEVLGINVIISSPHLRNISLIDCFEHRLYHKPYLIGLTFLTVLRQHVHGVGAISYIILGDFDIIFQKGWSGGNWATWHMYGKDLLYLSFSIIHP